MRTHGPHPHSAVLNSRIFSLTQTKQIQNATPIGLVFLRSVSKIDRGVDGPNGTIDAFAMHTPERVYIFACQNNREVGAWLDAIKPYVKLTGKVADVIKTGFLTKQGGSFKVPSTACASAPRPAQGLLHPTPRPSPPPCIFPPCAHARTPLPLAGARARTCAYDPHDRLVRALPCSRGSGGTLCSARTSSCTTTRTTRIRSRSVSSTLRSAARSSACPTSRCVRPCPAL